jgi:hypothetical protein
MRWNTLHLTRTEELCKSSKNCLDIQIKNRGKE